MAWTKTKPIVPLKYPSSWYWYYEDKEKITLPYIKTEPWVIQLYPGRTLHAYNGLWWDKQIDRVTDKPKLPKEVVEIVEEVEESEGSSPPIKRRGRPKGSKNKPKE